MGLLPGYENVLPPDHIRALRDAIVWSVDHALDEIAALERAAAADEEIDWAGLRFFNRLPTRYRHVYTPLFAKQFAVCLVTATDKMADPRRAGGLAFASVAEELAADLVIKSAEELLASERRERGIPVEDVSFGGLYELAFEDTDIEMLYRPEADGIERDPGAEQDMGVVHLAPERWFAVFPGSSGHPYASELEVEDLSAHHTNETS